MVGLQFNGRLGNQIFQYAFLKYLQTNNPNKTFLFTNPHHSYLTKYFDLGTYDNILLGSKVFSIFPRILDKVLKNRVIYIQNIQIPREVIVKDWVVYKGFFQTDWYVKRIIGNFNISIKPEFVTEFSQNFGHIFDNYKTIVVHIRRTDYLKYGKRDISLPMEYFKKRLDLLGKIDECKVLFVSDDMQHVKSYFKEKPNYIFSSNNEITDFQIIKNADIAIISNSSFAWWACYLSGKKQTVYGPKNWLGFRLGKEHPKQVMTDRFTWCDVMD
jgi:hypothetical protein